MELEKIKNLLSENAYVEIVFDNILSMLIFYFGLDKCLLSMYLDMSGLNHYFEMTSIKKITIYKK